MHYAVPRLLHQAGRLEQLYTDSCAMKGWPRTLKFLPASLRTAGMRRLQDRTPLGVPRSRITAFTTFGCEYARRLTRATTPSDITALLLWAGRTFCEKITQGGLREAAAVYAFNNAALELLQHARERGRVALMEQTIAPKQIECDWLRDEHEKFPDWEPTPAPDHFLDEFIAREADEWQAADVIICGSEFVREGIAQCGGPVHRCKVVPYGVDSFFQAAERRPRHGPLRILTVGEIGLRKGSPYVLAAARQLRYRVTFRMIGQIKGRPETVAQLREAVELTGPVPRSEILAHFQWADVFLLPSLCEGSATVAYEALACGLPVITTPNTGTVVRDGVEGFIVPARDVDGIVQSLEKLVDDRNLLREMSEKAKRRSTEFDFSVYQKKLLAALPPDHDAPLPSENLLSTP
jgi:glycosyltransferase involved in cell wall biosynthesis